MKLSVLRFGLEIIPLHAPAGAKAILSFVGIEQIDRLLDEELESLTDNTVTSRDELHLRLVEYNKLGYAVDNEELHLGIYALGVPIFDYLSQPIAAISAVMPVIRISEKREAEIVNELKRTAKIIATQINKKRTLYPYQQCY